jgi:hypothetical protein
MNLYAYQIIIQRSEVEKLTEALPTLVRIQIKLKCIYRSSPCRAVNKIHLDYKH